jgi:hypothetical protein
MKYLLLIIAVFFTTQVYAGIPACSYLERHDMKTKETPYGCRGSVSTKDYIIIYNVQEGHGVSMSLALYNIKDTQASFTGFIKYAFMSSEVIYRLTHNGDNNKQEIKELAITIADILNLLIASNKPMRKEIRLTKEHIMYIKYDIDDDAHRFDIGTDK